MVVALIIFGLFILGIFAFACDTDPETIKERERFLKALDAEERRYHKK